jgi:uncharacterized protein (TIGR04255 family)
MVWNVPPQEHKVFERNPLVAVVVELRFHPVLKISDRIADFQDRVRATFPVFQEVLRQLVNLGPVAPIEVRNERMFNLTKGDESATLTLSTSSLALESRLHEHRNIFIADAKVGIDALVETFGPIVPTRLGLRYVDIIDREQIEKALGRPTSWDALLSERFLSIPTGLADLSDTLFACEVASSVPSGGRQTVRYGLVEDADKRVKYRLDVDRYIEERVEPGALVPLLGAFADDIYAVFAAAMGPALSEWMEERRS